MMKTEPRAHGLPLCEQLPTPNPRRNCGDWPEAQRAETQPVLGNKHQATRPAESPPFIRTAHRSDKLQAKAQHPKETNKEESTTHHETARRTRQQRQQDQRQQRQQKQRKRNHTSGTKVHCVDVCPPISHTVFRRQTNNRAWKTMPCPPKPALNATGHCLSPGTNEASTAADPARKQQRSAAIEACLKPIRCQLKRPCGWPGVQPH